MSTRDPDTHIHEASDAVQLSSLDSAGRHVTPVPVASNQPEAPSQAESSLSTGQTGTAVVSTVAMDVSAPSFSSATATATAPATALPHNDETPQKLPLAATVPLSATPTMPAQIIEEPAPPPPPPPPSPPQTRSGDQKAAPAVVARTDEAGAKKTTTNADVGTENKDEHASEERRRVAGSGMADICEITLLLPSSSRHPLKLSQDFLARHNIVSPPRQEGGTDSGNGGSGAAGDAADNTGVTTSPFNMSVYSLKELILRDWQSEWGAPPTSPGSIRLIFFGKLLEDKMPLEEYKFSHTGPNFVHMTIRPQEVEEDDTAKAGKGKGATDRSPGRCFCCVVS